MNSSPVQPLPAPADEPSEQADPAGTGLLPAGGIGAGR
jgi:hypothetical protein